MWRLPVCFDVEIPDGQPFSHLIARETLDDLCPRFRIRARDPGIRLAYSPISVQQPCSEFSNLSHLNLLKMFELTVVIHFGSQSRLSRYTYTASIIVGPHAFALKRLSSSCFNRLARGFAFHFRSSSTPWQYLWPHLSSSGIHFLRPAFNSHNFALCSSSASLCADLKINSNSQTVRCSCRTCLDIPCKRPVINNLGYARVVGTRSFGAASSQMFRY